MQLKKETEKGTVFISGTVIERIVYEDFQKLSGRAGLTNKKGKDVTAKPLKNGSLDSKGSIEIRNGVRGLDVNVYLKVRFGSSIAKVTEQLIENVKFDVERMTGFRTNSTAVEVKGMLVGKDSRKRVSHGGSENDPR